MSCRVANSSQLLTSCLALVAGLLGGVGGSLFFERQSEQAPQQPERIVCKELQLESLVLVDRHGKQIGWMRATGDSGATLMLGRGEGRPMVVLQIDEIEGTPSALLSVAAPEPVPPPAKPAPASASINCSSGQPRLCLISASGRKIELGSTTQDPEATLTVGRLGGGGEDEVAQVAPASFPSEFRRHERRQLVLRNHQSPGDVLMLTAAVRDLTFKV